MSNIAAWMQTPYVYVVRNFHHAASQNVKYAQAAIFEHQIHDFIQMQLFDDRIYRVKSLILSQKWYKMND